MKKKNRLMLLCPAIVVLLLYGEWIPWLSQGNIFDAVEEAIQIGDSKKLLPHFNSFVDINVNGEEATYSRSQAEFTCGNFFQQYPVDNFFIAHIGKAKKGLEYAIGQYESSSHNYSVLIKVRTVREKFLVYEMSFIEE